MWWQNSVIMPLKTCVQCTVKFFVKFVTVWAELGCYVFTPLLPTRFFASGTSLFKIFFKISNFMYTFKNISKIIVLWCIFIEIFMILCFHFLNFDFITKYFLVIMHHSFGNLNTSVSIPKYSFINFWDPKGNYFFWLWVIHVTLTMILKNITQ